MRPLTSLVTLVLVAGVVAPACSDEQSEFCDRLRDRYELTDLRDALNRGDDEATEEALADLEELARRAPSEIAGDVEAVVDAVVDSVRAVTGVPGPDGDTLPVDLNRLNEALAGVDEQSARVLEWGERECELELTAP